MTQLLTSMHYHVYIDDVMLLVVVMLHVHMRCAYFFNSTCGYVSMLYAVVMDSWTAP